MPQLDNATLRITTTNDGSGERFHVTASVDVTLTHYEQNLAKLGMTYLLRCRIWGEDSGARGADDEMYSFSPSKIVRSPGRHTFEANVARRDLNEDYGPGADELYARFELTSRETPYARKAARSVTQTAHI